MHKKFFLTAHKLINIAIRSNELLTCKQIWSVKIYIKLANMYACCIVCIQKAKRLCQQHLKTKGGILSIFCWLRLLAGTPPHIAAELSHYQIVAAQHFQHNWFTDELNLDFAEIAYSYFCNQVQVLEFADYSQTLYNTTLW